MTRGWMLAPALVWLACCSGPELALAQASTTGCIQGGINVCVEGDFQVSPKLYDLGPSVCWQRDGARICLSPSELPAVVCPERSVAGNFAADLAGLVLPGDADRPDIWGLREAVTWPLKFDPPAGYRVRLLGVSADLTARLTTRGSAPVLLSGAYPFVGVLLGVQTRAESAGSEHADWAADDVLAYGQADIGLTGAARVEIREDWRGLENALLGPDNTVWFKAAKYLDETGWMTHLEVTFSQLRFRYEREGERCD